MSGQTILILFATTLVLVVCYISGPLAAIFTCTRTVLQVSPNQDGTSYAIIYDLSCGALAGSTNVVLLGSPNQLYLVDWWLKPQFVFDSDYDRRVSLLWKNSNELVLNVPSELRRYAQVQRWEEIQIGIKAE
jgi:hypothetical protein